MDRQPIAELNNHTDIRVLSNKVENIETLLTTHEARLQVANSEMGAVKVSLQKHDTILEILMKDISSLNAKGWAIIIIIVGTAIAILFK